MILLINFMFPKMEVQLSMTLKGSLMRIDWLGLTLCLAASIVMILPLQEGGTQYAWNSGPFISMIAAGDLSWTAFACWESWLSCRPGERVLLPMLPHHVVAHRVIGTCIVYANILAAIYGIVTLTDSNRTSFLTGMAFTSIVVYLPQRFQAVNNLSPVKSGINILPVLLISALGATASGLVLSKWNICSYLIIAGNALQLIGLALQSSLPTTAVIPAAAYGYQAILGLGLGTTLSASFILARIEVRREDIGTFAPR